MSFRSPRDVAAIGLLALLPTLAYAPAWLEGRLLGPRDGAALHFPLRAEAFAAWRRGEVPAWNPSIFSGAPLLASFRPGVLHPLMLLLAPLPSFVAFQLLVLISLGATASLTYLYVRTLGAGRVGAYFAGLAFGLGPYVVGHLGDTATLVAIPGLLLLLLAAENHISRPRPASPAWLAAAIALVLFSGSPEAARAGGALLMGRLSLAYLVAETIPPRWWRGSLLAVASGLLLAAPQLVPSVLAFQEAGRQATGMVPSASPPLPGLTGLVLRYVSHTPAAALAVAALPLWPTVTAIPAFVAWLVACLVLQWGRGPLSAPGALSLLFDLGLALLAGLSLDVQWRDRRGPRGRRWRSWFLWACLLSAAALSVSAAALGPLPETLAGAVGVLAVALILYFSSADDKDPIKAGVFLLPLTAAFALQPQGRDVWAGAPLRSDIETGTAVRRAVDQALSAQPLERTLTIVREWPREARDLAYANESALLGRRAANGYDPMVPLRTRAVFDGMSASGLLSGAFLRTDPRRLELLGLRYVQVPVSALVATPDERGLGETLDAPLEAGHARLFPVPINAATELRLATHLSNAVDVPDGRVVANVEVRLASGRSLPLQLVAGRDTAEWAYERPDVRRSVAHSRARVLDSWPEKGFSGHRYLSVLRLPGRYFVDGVRIEVLAGSGVLTIGRMAFADGASGRSTPFSLVSAYVSETAVLHELLAIPGLRLYELPRSPGRVHMARSGRTLADDKAVLSALAAPLAAGLDSRHDFVTTEALPQSQPHLEDAGPATLAREVGGTLDARGEGPGLLVLAESYDPGWSAEVDGQGGAPVVRVNHAQMGVWLGAGPHRVTFHYRPRGFWLGLALAACGALLLGLHARRVLASKARASSEA